MSVCPTHNVERTNYGGHMRCPEHFREALRRHRAARPRVRPAAPAWTPRPVSEWEPALGRGWKDDHEPLA